MERKLGFELKTVGNLVKRKLDALETFAASQRLTGAHGWIIGYLYEKSQEGVCVYQRDIEEQFEIRRSSVANIVKRMEDNGIIIREGVEGDGRLKKLTLTDKGCALHEAVAKEFDKFEAELVAGIDKKELADLFATIDKIKANALK